MCCGSCAHAGRPVSGCPGQVLRLRGHDRTRAAALVLSYRTEAVLVPAYVRSIERWLATAAR